MPGSLSCVQDVKIAFLFEIVWKTLTSPWLEKLLPFKLHFEMAIIIDSLALKFPTAWKEQLPTPSKDDHVINIVEH